MEPMSKEATSRQPTIALAETPHSHALAECLKKLGVRLLPFARNSQSSGAIPLERWIVQLVEGEFDDVVFTSAQGVHLMVEMSRQLEKSDAFLEALSVARKIARGAKPARALSELGLNADVVTRRPDLDALIAAAQSRLRPILATATTTVCGLIPLSLQGGELWRPMANTIIFGLSFSTLLTLLLCPVLYALFFRVGTQKTGAQAEGIKSAP